MTPTVSDDAKSRQHSPPTERAIRVVELLADTSFAPATLADIVRRTGFPRATAHAIVSELVAHRWAVRDRVSGEFAIGPAMATLARQVNSADRLGDWVGPAVRELSAELDMPCFVARRTGRHEITVIAQSWSTDEMRSRIPWLSTGHPIALRAPISREFIAWAPADEQAAWIEQAPASLRTRLRLALDAIAERGYSVERMSDDYVAMTGALNSLGGVSDSLRSRMGDLLTELTTIDYLPDELTGAVQVITVGAPIFDDAGTVTASVVACPSATLAVADLRRVGAAVRRAADSAWALELSAAHPSFPTAKDRHD